MSMSDQDHQFLNTLARIADALESRNPPDPDPAQLPQADAYVWNRTRRRMTPVERVNRVELRLLCGIDQQRDTLLSNTIAFVRGFAANNALLWGARGTGKSSLVKAIHGTVTMRGMDCALVEIHREDIDKRAIHAPFGNGAVHSLDQRRFSGPTSAP